MTLEEGLTKYYTNKYLSLQNYVQSYKSNEQLTKSPLHWQLGNTYLGN